MPDIRLFVEHSVTALPVVGVAMVGAFLQALHGPWKGWKSFAVSAATAGFCAYIVDFLFRAWGVPDGVNVFAAGMIGWSGGSLMDHFYLILKRKLEERGRTE